MKKCTNKAINTDNSNEGKLDLLKTQVTGK